MTNKVIVQKTVGEITIKGEASSDRRDISMQDLLNIATAATGEQTITGREGVNIVVHMAGPDAPAEPLFTPVDQLQEAVDAMQKLHEEIRLLQSENKRLLHSNQEYQRRLKVIRDHA